MTDLVSLLFIAMIPIDFKITNSFLTLVCSINAYSSSQNNVNILNCNYKEITSSYTVITKRNLFHSMLNAGIC